MKYLLIILIVSFSKFIHSGFNFYNDVNNYFNLKVINLKDGEEFKINTNVDLTFSPYYYKSYDFFKDPRTYNDLLNDSIFFDINALTFNKKAIIRSFETENNNSSDLIPYINRIAIGRGLGYTNILNNDITITDHRYAFFHSEGGYNWEKINNFSSYYHSLFKSKTARTILFDESLEIIKKMCIAVPNDFRKRIIDELDVLLNFSHKLPSLTYSESSEFSDYWKGFIYRRHFVDKIPVAEIQSSILKAKKELNELNLEKQFAYKLIVNNEVEIFLSYNNFIIKSIQNNKELKFENKHLINIKFLKDNKTSYYQITNSSNLYKNESENKILFDANLKIIE